LPRDVRNLDPRLPTHGAVAGGEGVDVTTRIDLEEPEQERLARILRCEPGELEAKLRPYAAAALEEYVRMFLGERVFTRGADIREYRLLLLMKHVLDGAVPDDDYVSALFQTNTGQSRGLIRAVLSKFQYEVETGVHGSVKQVVDRARREGDDNVWTVIIRSGNVVDALNREIDVLSGALPLARKTPGTAARYEINRSTYLKLCEALGVEVKDDPGD
jgi:hypothetical protein